jgi:hypothetical protein
MFAPRKVLSPELFRHLDLAKTKAPALAEAFEVIVILESLTQVGLVLLATNC